MSTPTTQLSVTPTPAPAHSNGSAAPGFMASLSTLLNSAAMDVAGLGVTGAACWAAATGKSPAVYTPMFTFGGIYLGKKVSS